MMLQEIFDQKIPAGFRLVIEFYGDDPSAARIKLQDGRDGLREKTLMITKEAATHSMIDLTHIVNQLTKDLGS